MEDLLLRGSRDMHGFFRTLLTPYHGTHDFHAGFGTMEFHLGNSQLLETYAMAQETFPIDLGKLKPLKLDPAVTSLSEDAKATLRHNI